MRQLFVFIFIALHAPQHSLYAQTKSTAAVARSPGSSASAFQQYVESEKQQSYLQSLLQSETALQDSISSPSISDEEFQKKLITPSELNELVARLVRQFMENGDVSKKFHVRARLKFIFENRSEFRDYYFNIWSELNLDSPEIASQKNISDEVASYLKDNLMRVDLSEAKVLADGILISTQLGRKLNLNDNPRSWALLSNTYQPLIVFGSWDDFLKAQKKLVPLVQGTCSQPQVYQNLVGYYDEACVVKFTENLELENRISVKKTDETTLLPWPGWAQIILGAAVVGFSAKNKIILEKPGLR